MVALPYSVRVPFASLGIPWAMACLTISWGLPDLSLHCGSERSLKIIGLQKSGFSLGSASERWRFGATL